ncbi:glycosyltransferase [Rhodobacter sp. TJ_12]|uniref:glycosyltransferase n=1 Tax=Rhodobacter sp. TJ_12 TaxID=2029399 RepID=UPI001CBC6072|nr:glycosyltransferase [Rhodobacter sp. TJ_12]
MHSDFAASTPMPGDKANVLVVPMHPGIQYHFCRCGLDVSLLGHWDQFRYWRPRPPNVTNLFDHYDDGQLKLDAGGYRAALAAIAPKARAWNRAWLHFPWQFKLFREDHSLPKLFFAAKEDELSEAEWDEVLSRADFSVASYYPRTTAWVRDRFGVDLPEIELGLSPTEYAGWTGAEETILTVIHSWHARGWNHALCTEATAGLPHRHIDHLDRAQEPVDYDGLRSAFRNARVYLHDGEREYTITLIEAMMTGMPIVSPPLPGIERYVIHGENGLIGHTAAELRAHCQMLLADHDLAARFGAASRKLALANHHEDRWVRDWQALLGAPV